MKKIISKIQTKISELRDLVTDLYLLNFDDSAASTALDDFECAINCLQKKEPKGEQENE